MSDNAIITKCFGSPVIKEIVAGGTIMPGMIIKKGSAGTVAAHASQGQNVAPIMVALENSLQGNDKDDAYAADDVVRVWFPQPGDEGQLILSDGENVAIGDLLESAGNGYVDKYVADTGDSDDPVTVYPRTIIAEVNAAVNLSGSSGTESSAEGAIDATLNYNRRLKVTFV